MRTLILGSGGREHALVYGIKRDGGEVFAIPGNDGMEEAICENIGVGEFEKIYDFIKREGIDLVIVGPENPLVEGIVDFMEDRGVKIFGPSKVASQLEGSKIFAKNFMSEYGIPTAKFEVYDSSKRAISDIEGGKFSFPVVLKCDGLAAGKGVVISNDKKGAISIVLDMMERKVFKDAGEKIVVEEFLEGKELSYMVISDGENFVPFVPSRDHKKVFDGERGPNTGGMGAIAWESLIDDEVKREIEEKIIKPVIRNFPRKYCEYRGVLYAGLMLTREGPKVLEFNCRFGDPETQPEIFKMDSSLLEVIERSIDGKLGDFSIKWKKGCSLCVVLASSGYPGKYEKGKEIMVGNLDEDVKVFYAGVEKRGGKYFTSGGRVLSLTGIGTDSEDARKKVYSNVEKIYFEGVHFRWDIGEII